MIFTRLVKWFVSKNPDKYHNLHLDLIGIRSGLTLEQFLNRALLVGLGTGIVLGVVGLIFGYVLFTLNLGLKPELYNVLNISFDPNAEALPIFIVAQIIFGTLLFIFGFFIGYWAILSRPGKKISRNKDHDWSSQCRLIYVCHEKGRCRDHYHPPLPF